MCFFSDSVILMCTCCCCIFPTFLPLATAGLRVVCGKKCATTTACWWPWRNRRGELKKVVKLVTIGHSSKSLGYNTWMIYNIYNWDIYTWMNYIDPLVLCDSRDMENHHFFNGKSSTIIGLNRTLAWLCEITKGHVYHDD